jgi:mono/diheme cytochrome c family protein
VTLASGLAALAAVLLLAATALIWQQEPVSVRAAARSGSAPRGAELFRAKGCAMCHTGPESRGSTGLPDLSDASAWAGRRRPGFSAEDYLRQSIRDPGAFVAPGFRPSGPVTGMPTLSVSDEEVDALVAYLLAR